MHPQSPFSPINTMLTYRLSAYFSNALYSGMKFQTIFLSVADASIQFPATGPAAYSEVVHYAIAFAHHIILSIAAVTVYN